MSAKKGNHHIIRRVIRLGRTLSGHDSDCNSTDWNTYQTCLVTVIWRRKTRVEKPELHRHKEASKQPCRSCCSVSKHEEVAKQHSICRSRKEVAEHTFWIVEVVAVCILSQHYAL